MSVQEIILAAPIYETDFSLGLEDVKVRTVAASSYHSVSLTGRRRV